MFFVIRLDIHGTLNTFITCSLYDRSLEIAGYEYRSDLLWEAAIQYQENQNQPIKVFTLLRQLIATPTQQYKSHFTMLVVFSKEYLNNYRIILLSS